MKRISISIIVMAFAAIMLFPCSVFKISHQGTVLAGNNEDYSDPMPHIWFIPPSPGKYGRVYFGYSQNYPQGGVNDQGLFFDWVAGYWTGWQRTPEKPEFNGNLNVTLLAHCATVEDAIKLYKKYDYRGFKAARILLADRSGASVIIGWQNGELHFHRSSGGVQALGYKEAVAKSQLKKLIDKSHGLSIDDAKNILDATHQEGLYPTQYSNICDLTNNMVYLYLFYDYQKMVRFNLAEEFKKGEHDYRMLTLFPDHPRAHAYNENYKKEMLQKYHKLKANPLAPGSDQDEQDLMMLAYRLDDLKEPEKAFEMFRLFVEIFPNSWEAHASLGYAYIKIKGDDIKGEECFAKALELSPNNRYILGMKEDLLKKRRK